MIDEVTELRAHLEREQSLRVELEEQLKDYAARLGETFVNVKPKENTQTTIQYHHNANTVSDLIQYILLIYNTYLLYLKTYYCIYFSVWLAKKPEWR